MDSKAIPSVNLLVHGGYHACKQIKENLHGHPNIPTVIVKGSGGLADAIANAFKAATEGRKGFVSKVFLSTLFNVLSFTQKELPWELFIYELWSKVWETLAVKLRNSDSQHIFEEFINAHECQVYTDTYFRQRSYLPD